MKPERLDHGRRRPRLAATTRGVLGSASGCLGNCFPVTGLTRAVKATPTLRRITRRGQGCPAGRTHTPGPYPQKEVEVIRDDGGDTTADVDEKAAEAAVPESGKRAVETKKAEVQGARGGEVRPAGKQ